MPIELHELYNDLENSMMQLFNRYSERCNRKCQYHDVKLYQNEIRTVEYIAVSSATNFTDIASHTGLTRSAVSKMITKLEGMGLLVRYKYYPKQKEVYVHLTEEGVKAYESWKAFRKPMDEHLRRFLSSIPEEECTAIRDYLNIYLDEMQMLP